MSIQGIKNTILNFLVPLAALVLTMGLFFIVIYPSVQSLPLLREELAAKNTLENQLRTKLANLNKLSDFDLVVKENADVVSRVLVPEPDVPVLLTQIDIIAKDSGLEVNKLSYSFGETTEAETLLPYSVVNVTLGADGNYGQINTFLATLESSARLVDVSTLRFASQTSEDTQGIFNTTFILRSPYLNVDSSAVTDEPVNVDISDPDFLAVLDIIKQLRFYNITIDTKFEDVEESTPEEIEQSIEEEEPETSPEAETEIPI